MNSRLSIVVSRFDPLGSSSSCLAYRVAEARQADFDILVSPQERLRCADQHSEVVIEEIIEI